MDKLTVIRKAEELGGNERRSALERLMIEARKLGCEPEVGGGRVGGINFRFGSLRLAVMDINVKGEVKLYVQPHPNKAAPAELSDRLNQYIKDCEGINIKTFPLSCYGHVEGPVETLPDASLSGYLNEAVQLIKQTYYQRS